MNTLTITDITGRNKSAVSTRVRFEGVTTETNDDLTSRALTAAGETASSLFGVAVERYDEGVVTVALHTS